MSENPPDGHWQEMMFAVPADHAFEMPDATRCQTLVGVEAAWRCGVWAVTPMVAGTFTSASTYCVTHVPCGLWTSLGKYAACERMAKAFVALLGADWCDGLFIGDAIPEHERAAGALVMRAIERAEDVARGAGGDFGVDDVIKAMLEVR